MSRARFRVADFIGARFGDLTVQADAGRAADSSQMVVANCCCGTKRTVRLSNLRLGNTVSCGCKGALAADFWDNAIPEPNSGCLIWMAGVCPPLGHGAIKINGVTVGAHRRAWELVNGPIPAGLVIRHKCDVPPCINPAHLCLGTQADNIADKESRGRGNHTGPKLNAALANEIRKLICEGAKRKDLAKQFNCSYSSIINIATGRTYSKVS